MEKGLKRNSNPKYFQLQSIHLRPHAPKKLSPGVMARIAPSSIIPMVPKRITIPIVIAILRITIFWPGPVVSRKFGAIVWWNERLIKSSSRRRSLWRGEVRVVSVPASIGLRRVGPERILVLRTDGVGCAGWVQELFVVAEDDKEE